MERFQNIEVRIGNEDPEPPAYMDPITVNEVCDPQKATIPNANPVTYLYHCQPTLTGRFISVQKMSNGDLSLNEVLAYTKKTTGKKKSQNQMLQ